MTKALIYFEATSTNQAQNTYFISVLYEFITVLFVLRFSMLLGYKYKYLH